MDGHEAGVGFAIKTDPVDILINIEGVSKHSVAILGLRVATPAGLEHG